MTMSHIIERKHLRSHAVFQSTEKLEQLPPIEVLRAIIELNSHCSGGGSDKHKLTFLVRFNNPHFTPEIDTAVYASTEFQDPVDFGWKRATEDAWLFKLPDVFFLKKFVEASEANKLEFERRLNEARAVHNILCSAKAGYVNYYNVGGVILDTLTVIQSLPAHSLRVHNRIMREDYEEYPDSDDWDARSDRIEAEERRRRDK